MACLRLTPLASLHVTRQQIPRHNLLPNTSIQQYPLLIYHSCFPHSALASSIESHLKEVGVVIPQWRYTMYSTTHFHSTTHAKLCTREKAYFKIATDGTPLGFGGEENPDRLEISVQSGDVIVVPAGVSHCLFEDIEGEFEMIGSYPEGANWDMCYGRAEEEEKIKRISKLGWFKKDPIYDESGPVMEI